MPFLTTSALRELLSQDGDTDAAVARADGRDQPLLAGYDRRIGLRIEEMLASGERSLMALLARIDVRYVDLDNAEAAFSVNTPEQLARARSIAETQPPK
jgi:molybdopterin-guanine dinucleotide biosynthesis protein A